jgi:hypothetical protein
MNFYAKYKMASVFPSIIDASDLYHLIREIHHTPMDFQEGDIRERIFEYSKYHLDSIPIASLNLNEWELDESRVKTIENNIRSAGYIIPIVFDTHKGTIIDGIHRANAAKNLGLIMIPAYIPIIE